MKISLRLAYRPTPQRPATALLILGASPEHWLGQLDRWKVAHQSLKFLPLQSAATGTLANGALILLPKDKKTVSSGGFQYGQIGERFYLPVDSDLEPTLDGRELDKLLRQLPGDDGQSIYVWSPAHGLVRYAPSEILSTQDLLAPPKVTRGNWLAPPPGEMRPTKLNALAPRQLPDPQAILQEGRDGIGGLAGEKKIDTPSPQESGPLARGLQALCGAAAGAIASTPFLPQSWAQSLQKWAQNMMQRSADSLSAMRNREMARLMNLLEKNPDEGLQYAIPLRPDQAPRGVAPPGANLTRRNLNFGAWGTGTGAGDPWDIHRYEAELLRRYHALAQREIQLGRFRRAAYIYAELLGNLELAATTLEQGGDYREAAVIYEKRLNRPQQAADAYLRGGLWTEGIRLLEQLEQHERVGDTYTKLGETDRARLAYERALDQRRQANDYLDAVRILETKLLDIDGAIELSLTGWPETQQAKACLQKHFELLEKNGRHEEAARRLKSVASTKLFPRRQVDLINSMSQMAQRYPDAEVRTTAKDRTRYLASQLLKVKGQVATEEIISAVQRLEPSEVIHGRDCRRYLTQVGRAQKEPRTSVAKPSTSGITQRIALPSDVQWMSAISSGKFFYAAGWRDGKLIVARGAWSGIWQTIAQPKAWTVQNQGGPILLAIEPVIARQAALIVHPRGGDPLGYHLVFPIGSGDLAFSQKVVALKAATPATDEIVFLSSNNVLVLDEVNQADQLICKNILFSTQELRESFVIDRGIGQEKAVYCFLGSELWMGLGTELRSVFRKESETLTTMNTIRRLDGAWRGGRLLLIAAHDEGASLFGSREHENAYVAEDLKDPVACVTTCGACIIAAREGIVAYEFAERGPKLLWKHDALDSKPIAALSTGIGRQFGLLLENGEMRVFSIGR